MEIRRLFGLGIDKEVEPQRENHDELETRLDINPSDKLKLDEALQKAGAKVLVPERVLATTRFKLPKQLNLAQGGELPIDVVDETYDSEVVTKLQMVLGELGLRLSSEDVVGVFKVSKLGTETSFKGLTVRIRQQQIGNRRINTFTIKGPKNKIGDIKSRRELEVDLANVRPLVELFNMMGIEEGDYREKRRITYQAGKVKAEVDFYPGEIISLELEGHTEQDIHEAEKYFSGLGNFAAIGETDYLKAKGFTKEQMKEMRLNPLQRHYSKIGRNY